ncbi:Hydroxypyruvate isomerase [Geobacillus stearothermophilus]|nr:Hydroxypyruvate isomerase [Geobacillus stearothermophilus]
MVGRIKERNGEERGLMMKFAVNVSTIFTEAPFLARFCQGEAAQVFAR